MRARLRDAALRAERIQEFGRRMRSFSLLTFAPGEEERHLPSAIVRFLKGSRMTAGCGSGSGPALAVAFGRVAARRCAGFGITAVCRVLSSRETDPSADAPMEVVAIAAAEALRARVCHPIHRSAPRSPMSLIPRLSGPDTLRERIVYAAQDLVVREDLAGERVLLLDDIRCTGASEAVWGWALTEIAGAQGVTAVSLAQAEGMDPEQDVLDVETEGIRREARACAGALQGAFDPVWLELAGRVLHRNTTCRSISGDILLWWRAPGRGTRDCPECMTQRGGILKRLLHRE